MQQQVQSTLVEAITRRLPVVFLYDNGTAAGERTGNPHALYVERLKDGTNRTYLHLWLTAGVSQSKKQNPWRKFRADQISEVRILGENTFEVAQGYNPDFYEKVVALVS